MVFQFSKLSFCTAISSITDSAFLLDESSAIKLGLLAIYQLESNKNDDEEMDDKK